MTERLQKLYLDQWERKHHAFRKNCPIDPAPYRDPALKDYQRTALRLKLALESESPVLMPDEIIAFTRTVPNLPMIFSEEEWKEIKAQHYIHENGNVCNLSPDYGKVLGVGLRSIREGLEDTPYHNAVRQSVDAILALTERYAQYAREAGDEELADILTHVPALPPRTFREALQALRILHYAMWCEGDYHNTLGRFDQYMMPYLQRDLDALRLDRASALELVEAFFLSCNRDSDLYPGMQQGDNGQSMALGGLTSDGRDGYNLLSELCLEASAELKLIDPKINLRVSAKTPLSVYEKGTELTKLGLGFPQYENDDVIVPALVNWGYQEEDARNYALAACWEVIIPGKGMDIPNIGAVPLANIVDAAIREKLPEVRDMDELLNVIQGKIDTSVQQIAQQVKKLYVIPSPFISIFFDGCLSNQRDVSLGCIYNNYGLHGTGLAPAVDMLAAVEEMIFLRGMSPQTLLNAMADDFEGHEELQHALRQCPKMGNDDDRADRFSGVLLGMFAKAVEGLKNERGGCFRAGTGSAMYYIWHAQELGATADGRKRGVPLPANYAPSLNLKMEGPLSLIQSFTKPDLKKVANGGPLTIEFSDSAFRTPEAITKVAQLVRIFIQLGGHQLQLNTLNRETLLDAKRHPEAHRNLIVRVWGWSGYFVELDECYQDHIINRVQLTV